LTGWLCNGWDSSLIKYDGEVFLDKLSSARLLVKGGEVLLERRNTFCTVTINLL